LPIGHHQAEQALRAFALGLQDTAAWGKRFVRVRGKIFVSLQVTPHALTVAVKPPVSAEMALTLPFCSPGERALGGAGWVTARFGPGEQPPLDLLKEWIGQSYRTVRAARGGPERDVAQ
jgi:hypothetical protein